MKIPTQYQLIMPIWQFKAMWQCKWLNLVGTLQHLIIPAARGSLPMHCTAPTKVLIYSCTVTQLTKNSSVVKWGESYWRACEGIAWVRVASSIQSDTQLFSRLHYNSKVHSFTPWQWAKVVLIGVPECVSIEFALHCISWQCTAEIAMRCNSIAWAWHTHSGNARAVCAQPSKPNWS